MQGFAVGKNTRFREFMKGINQNLHHKKHEKNGRDLEEKLEINDPSPPLDPPVFLVSL